MAQHDPGASGENVVHLADHRLSIPRVETPERQAPRQPDLRVVKILAAALDAVTFDHGSEGQNIALRQLRELMRRPSDDQRKTILTVCGLLTGMCLDRVSDTGH